jgi:hypothetical protein
LQSDDAVNPDRLYDLVAVVVHCGSGPNRGHYISIVKSHGFWLLFDDDMVDVSINFSISLNTFNASYSRNFTAVHVIPEGGSRNNSNIPPRHLRYQNYLAMRITVDVTGGKPIAV